jgi:hypothetical protein
MHREALATRGRGDRDDRKTATFRRARAIEVARERPAGLRFTVPSLRRWSSRELQRPPQGIRVGGYEIEFPLVTIRTEFTCGE